MTSFIVAPKAKQNLIGNLKSGERVKKYSKSPKTGRPDFGIFEKHPVVKLSGFQTTSGNQTILSGYRTSS